MVSFTAACALVLMVMHVDARGLHGLSCRRKAPRQRHHSHLNDIIRPAMKRAQMSTVKEPRCEPDAG